MSQAITSIFLAAVMAGTALPALADDCVDFKWDTAKEHALFAGRADSLTLGTDVNSAPAIELQHLYELKLAPQTLVNFAVAPGKGNSTVGASRNMT